MKFKQEFSETLRREIEKIDKDLDLERYLMAIELKEKVDNHFSILAAIESFFPSSCIRGSFVFETREIFVSELLNTFLVDTVDNYHLKKYGNEWHIERKYSIWARFRSFCLKICLKK